MLERLSQNEQRALMELLLYLAKADGRVDEIEREVIENYTGIVDIRLDTLNGNLTPDELVPQFQSPASRVVVLQELFRLAHLDGLFDPDEQDVVLEIADMMNIPDEFLEKIERWVIDGLRWVWRGEELLDDAEEIIEGNSFN